MGMGARLLVGISILHLGPLRRQHTEASGKGWGGMGKMHEASILQVLVEMR
jgi:hypothetical protein